MRRMWMIALAMAGAAPTAADPPRASGAPGSPLETAIVDRSGETIGKARLTASPHGVLIRLQIEAGGLEPGWHGAHLHMVGDCSDTASFKRAGEHVGQPKSGVHGLLHPDGPEDGDLPNIFVNGDGSATAEIISTLTTLPQLRDPDGSALIVHANADDHLTQPIGGAGDRVACAAISKG